MPYPRRISTYQHGGGEIIPLNDARVMDVDITEFVDGNFTAVAHRRARIQQRPLNYTDANRNRTEWGNFLHAQLSDVTSSQMLLAAMEQLMLALVLRRASLVRQHQEIYDKTSNAKLKRMVWFRLHDLKHRSWITFLPEYIHTRMGRVFDQAKASVPQQETELYERWEALYDHFKAGGSGRGVRSGYRHTRPWAWR